MTDETLGSIAREFHREARANEVLSNIEVMLMEWQADHPEGKPFAIRISNRDYPRVTFEMIPREAQF